MCSLTVFEKKKETLDEYQDEEAVAKSWGEPATRRDNVMGELTRAALCVCECVACCLLFLLLLFLSYTSRRDYSVYRGHREDACMHFFQHPALDVDEV